MEKIVSYFAKGFRGKNIKKCLKPENTVVPTMNILLRRLHKGSFN